MVEARKRNPSILIGALAWVWPSWIGQGTSSPWTNATKTAGYIISWLKGARDVYNVSLDFIVRRGAGGGRGEWGSSGGKARGRAALLTGPPCISVSPVPCPPRRTRTGTSAAGTRGS